MNAEAEQAMQEIAEYIGGPPEEWPLAVAEDPSMLVNLWTRRDAATEELLEAAFIYISQCVDVEAALTDGFDVAAWCERVEARRQPHSQGRS